MSLFGLVLVFYIYCISIRICYYFIYTLVLTVTQGLIAPKGYGFEKRNVYANFAAGWQSAYGLDIVRKSRSARLVEDKNAVLTSQVAAVQQELDQLKAVVAGGKEANRKELENFKTASEKQIQALNGRTQEQDLEIVRLQRASDFEQRSAIVLSELSQGVKAMVTSAITEARAAVPDAVVAQEAENVTHRVSKADLEVVVHQVCYLT